MEEKVIATRKQFLEWNEILSNAKPLSDTSVEYREAVYVFRDKVERYIKNRASEIFAVDDSVKVGLAAYNDEIYQDGLKFAKNPPKEVGGDYEIEANNKEWLNVVAEIENKYKDVLEKRKKRQIEIEEWSAKKIQLNIEKIELSKMPSLDSDTFYKVAKILCIETPDAEDEGKEVE